MERVTQPAVIMWTEKPIQQPDPRPQSYGYSQVIQLYSPTEATTTEIAPVIIEQKWAIPICLPSRLTRTIENMMKLLLVCSTNFSDYLLYSNRKLERNCKPRKWRARNTLYIDDYPGLFLNCGVPLCKYYWWFSKCFPHLIYLLGFFSLLQWQGKFFSLGILIWRFWLNLVYSSEKLKAHMTLELWEEFRAKNELLCTHRREKKMNRKEESYKRSKNHPDIGKYIVPPPSPFLSQESRGSWETLRALSRTFFWPLYLW